MAAGEGKGWAKGRTARDDPRIARAAAAHRGKQQLRRAPSVDTTWSDPLAYAVGLIATDGCIARGRTIAFASADRELVEVFLRCLRRTNRISRITTRNGGVAYRTQVGDVTFCRWLSAIGIGPRKSLTIGAIDVPDAYLLPLMRGLLDGDGSIINKRARADTKRRRDYYWEYLRTIFLSASREHIVWLHERVMSTLGVSGYVALQRGREGGHDLFALRFGKRTSLILLPLLYADPNAPRLARKWRIWEDYRSRHAPSEVDRMCVTSPGGVTAASQV